MNIIHCDEDRHAEAILEILNESIINSTALYEYNPRPRESMVSWFEVKRAGKFPVLGIEDANEKLMGFASYGIFRERPAYKYSVEHSVYVHKDFRGKGIGDLLLKALLEEARNRDVHTMIGGIDLENEASIALHKKHGFKEAGIIKEAAFKFGRWLDLAFYQITFNTPENPKDG